jgi:O-antigen ligase
MKYLSHIDRSSFFSQLTFYCLLGSGAYIILLWSPHVLGDLLSRYSKGIIFIFPWLMLWLAYSWEVLTSRAHRPEILLMITIIVLGVINVSFSESRSSSLEAMRSFLLTGVFALWVAMFLFADPHRRKVFDWFCAGALAVVVLVEISIYLVRGNSGPGVFEIFTIHPIPLGTVVILLSPGPVRLLTTTRLKTRAMGGLLLLAGGLLIFLTHKRGTWLALAAVVLMGILYLARRQRYLVVAILLAIALILPLQAKRKLARLNPNVPHDASILNRLELYPFALHIWTSHPILGIGLRSFTHQQYLSDYQPHNTALRDFPYAVATLQTFENMALTSVVELGSCMTLVYWGLILFILIRYGRTLWGLPTAAALDWYRGFVLLGFAVHSLSYDSFLFPAVNWLFHVQVGIMASYRAPGRGPSEASGGAPRLFET